MQEYRITAVWDEEASVWTASSDDVIGLCLESESLDDLIKEAKVIIPELLSLNGQFLHEETATIPFRITAERAETIRNH
ncbi:MAG: DUF1902 domain-containing protein [bacterium]